MNVVSPCTGVCALDNHDVCVGCFRSRDEIAGWIRMTDVERLAVVATLDKRRKEPNCGNIKLQQAKIIT